MTVALELRGVEGLRRRGRTRCTRCATSTWRSHAGELVAIMGPSGSGKSTLLTIAGSLEEPTERRGARRRRRLSALSRNDRAALRRRSIGYVFQDFNLLAGLTAVENVALPLELDGVRVAARRAAGARGARASSVSADTADRFPDELSGGERQRVAIARAVVGDRRLLLADEPTGALDSVNGEAVMRLLRAACKRGVAGVVVTHDAQLASWADRVVFLRDGRVVDQTAPGARPRIAAHAGFGAAHHDRTARDRALGVAHVPARVAPADPRARAADRRGRRGRLRRHRRVQLAGVADRAVRHGEHAGQARQRPGAAAQDIATLERWFGPVEVIGHDFVRVPGSVDRVDVRAPGPEGPLRRGHAPIAFGSPARAHEVRSRSPTGSRARSAPTSATESSSAETRERSSASSRTPATCDDEFAW